MLLLDSFEHLKQNPKRGIHKNEYRFCVSCSYMRALECILDRGRVVCTVHTDIDIDVCDVTVHRERKGPSTSFLLFLLLLLFGRAGGLGLYSFSIDMLFFSLVFICYKCLNKKSELPSQDCVLLSIGVLKFLTTHSQRSSGGTSITSRMFGAVAHTRVSSVMSPRGVDVLLLICIYGLCTVHTVQTAQALRHTDVWK